VHRHRHGLRGDLRAGLMLAGKTAWLSKKKKQT
jgi:hypothetical protein